MTRSIQGKKKQRLHRGNIIAKAKINGNQIKI